MKRPSGDGCGQALVPSVVIARRFEPSASIVQICCPPRTGVVNRIRLSIVHATPAVPSYRKDGSLRGSPLPSGGIVDADHMRVVECGRGSRVLDEPGKAASVADDFRRQDLQGDQPAQNGVTSAIDIAHAALTRPRSGTARASRGPNRGGDSWSQYLKRVRQSRPPPDAGDYCSSHVDSHCQNADGASTRRP
jgi:hypothetical protein